MKLQGKQIGVLIALILAVIMLFLPYQDSSKYRFDPEAIARTIIEGTDQIDPKTLSEWIIEGRRDFILIDIRSEKEYEKGKIKGAENIPLQKLITKSTIEELPKDKIIVIYSNGSSHASQAWLVMKTAGIDAYILEGGFNYWSSFILNPAQCSINASDDEILKYRSQVAVSNYFGGSSPAASTVDDKTKTEKKAIEMPKKTSKKLKGC
ncbi:MAG: rhodanese-like domain-containing protein [Deltaproteobacteria bacterium]|jgi:rhodanese-related sulfurtransferase|nr:MAG: rhodanese-like domain-containing protein [Deltaproteobacteria bacterium]